MLANASVLTPQLDAMTMPLRGSALEAYRQVAFLAARDPNLAAANPAVQYAVRDSQVEQTGVIATR